MNDETLWQSTINGRDVDIYFRWDGRTAVVRACYVDGVATYPAPILDAFKVWVQARSWRIDTASFSRKANPHAAHRA